MAKYRIKRLKKGSEFAEQGTLYPVEAGPYYFRWRENLLIFQGPDWDERLVINEHFPSPLEGIVLVDYGKIMAVRHAHVEGDEYTVFKLYVANMVDSDLKPLSFPEFQSPRTELPSRVVVDVFNENCYLSYPDTVHHWQFRNNEWSLMNQFSAD